MAHTLHDRPMSATAQDIDGKIKIAKDLKQEGNDLVKQQDYAAAVKKYVKVRHLLFHLSSKTDQCLSDIPLY
jgi:hypothetical protein